MSAVERKNNIAANLLFRWRQELGFGRESGKRPASVAVALPMAVNKQSTA